jgi:RNA polymerase sigma-70 factor (ECF subfamily)
MLPRSAMTISYSRCEDAALVRMAQEDDTRAFDELVRRYQDKVYRLSYRILRHEDDAAEALQDAFLSAYRGLKNFKSESTFSTWLYRIATNSSLMKHRKRRDNHISIDQPLGPSGDGEPIQLRDWSSQPPEALLAAETRRVMEEGIGRLHEELRTVFLLRDVEDLSNAETAEVLQLSVTAVKSRLHRARVFLRDWMARYFGEEPVRRPARARAEASRPSGAFASQAV